MTETTAVGARRALQSPRPRNRQWTFVGQRFLPPN